VAKKLRIIYAGTPDFSVAALQALIESSHEVVAVYTQPDRPAGRGRGLRASPVKQKALEHNIPVYQPTTLKDTQAQQELSALNSDLMIVAAYGLLLPAEVLTIPRLGCINIHASLLPRWRGAAPIQRAILAGDKKNIKIF
jgi:methionyl-tRNA formyltransferase